MDFPLYQLAAASGMRRGEVLGLRWRDVDSEGSCSSAAAGATGTAPTSI